MKKFLYSFLLFITLLTACGQTTSNKYDDTLNEIHTKEAIVSKIEKQLLSNDYPPTNIDLIYINTKEDSTICSLAISFDSSEDVFLEQCYFAIPIITQILEENNLNNIKIDITATGDDDSPLIRLDYKSGNDVFVLNFIGESFFCTYNDLNRLNLTYNTIPSTNIQAPNCIIINDGEEKEGYFDGSVIDGFASGKGIFYSTNSSGNSYELHATFLDGYIDGDSELIFDNGNKVLGYYTKGIKNGTFTYYENTIGEFSEQYENGIQIGNTKYIKINDSYIRILVDGVFESEDNPSNWSNDKIGIEGMTDINDIKYKNAIADWQNAISEYEDLVFETFAMQFGMSIEDVEIAYARACMGEESFTYITPSSENDIPNSNE